MALPRARTAPLLLLAFHIVLIFVTAVQSKTLNLSSLKSSTVDSLSIFNNIPSVDDEYGDCYVPSWTPSELNPARQEDCLNAVNEVYNTRDPFRPTTFSRSSRVNFVLPEVVRNGSCVILIDVLHRTDSDNFKPLLVYDAAREIALKCTQGAFRFGGRTVTGPKRLVHVYVFGKDWPYENEVLEPVASESTVVAAGQRLTSRESSLLNESLTSTQAEVTRTIRSDKILGLNAPNAGSNLKCYDPPLPRERLWPIDVRDCEVATEAMLTDRQSDQKYTFSREQVTTSFYYHLPATFRYRSCVVHLDMNNNSDRDTVRLSIVEATAWVLAHKCSGEESSMEQYGGQGIVGVGSKGLINVWVYGRLWPLPSGATNMTNLILAQAAPFSESD